MPDISMCTKKDCPRSEECYRFKATPSGHWQSYMSPAFGEDGCAHFWPVESKSNYKRLEAVREVKEKK